MKVAIGLKVRIRFDSGKEIAIRVVNPKEADPFNNEVSLDSPIGQAVLGKKIDEEITYTSPRGPISFRIIQISI